MGKGKKRFLKVVFSLGKPQMDGRKGRMRREEAEMEQNLMARGNCT